MLIKIFPSLLIISYILNDVTGLDEYCYTLDTEKLQTLRYATKTAYEVIKGHMTTKDYIVPNCQPTKIWHLSRHGTRLPTANTIMQMADLDNIRNEIIDNYRVRRSAPREGALCKQDLDAIQGWQRNTSIVPELAEELTEQGYSDLFFLAKNYQSIFPHLYKPLYAENEFLFRHTNTSRTTNSFKAFVNGLFGRGAENYVKTQRTYGNDTLLKPYDSCSQWQEMNNAKEGPYSEISKFEESTYMKKVMEEVSQRLGFKYTLEKKTVKQMFDMCRYDQAWYVDRNSPWCAAFTPEHVKILEYNEDIKYYYKAGYGSNLNMNSPCAAVKDMLKHLETDSQPSSIVYFSHSVMVHMLITALGINKDKEPLRAADFERNGYRKWRVSLSGPFAANLAAVRYDCPNDVEKKKVIFFLNQKPVELDGCKVGLCDWNVMMKKYEKFYTGDCNTMYCSSGRGLLALSFLTIIPLILNSIV